MPDYQQFSVTRIAPAAMTVPRWQIELKVTNSQTGAVIRDFTGANAIIFPNVLGTYTNAQQDRLVELIVTYMIERKLET